MDKSSNDNYTSVCQSVSSNTLFFYLARDWKHDIKIFLSIFLSFGYNLRAHKLKNEADQSL